MMTMTLMEQINQLLDTAVLPVKVQLDSQQQLFETILRRMDGFDQHFHLLLMSEKNPPWLDQVHEPVQGLMACQGIQLDFPKYYGEDPTMWIHKAKTYFTLYQVPAHQQVLIASFFMEGMAATWFRYLENSEGFTTWEAFTDALTARFGPASPFDPMIELISLRQTGSVEEYKCKFDELGVRVHCLSETHRMSIFFAGLKKAIMLQVKMMKPENLQAAYALARIQEEIVAETNRCLMKELGELHVATNEIKEDTLNLPECQRSEEEKKKNDGASTLIKPQLPAEKITSMESVLATNRSLMKELEELHVATNEIKEDTQNLPECQRSGEEKKKNAGTSTLIKPQLPAEKITNEESVAATNRCLMKELKELHVASNEIKEDTQNLPECQSSGEEKKKNAGTSTLIKPQLPAEKITNEESVAATNRCLTNELEELHVATNEVEWTWNLQECQRSGEDKKKKATMKKEKKEKKKANKLKRQLMEAKKEKKKKGKEGKEEKRKKAKMEKIISQC